MLLSKKTLLHHHFMVFVLFIILALIPQKAKSVVNPEIIQWSAQDYGEFIISAFQGVLGRNATMEEFAAWRALGVASKRNKADLFWKLVSSPEYNDRFGHLDKKYWVYWDTKRKETDYGITLCHCYYFSEHEYVFMPTMQYIGIHCPSGPFNFGVATAIRYMYATFDTNTCTLFECGYKGTVPSDEYVSNSYEDCVNQFCPGCQNSITLLGVPTDPRCESCIQQYKAEIEACSRNEHNAGLTHNLVSDPNFATFGTAQSPWMHGNQPWGNSGYNQSSAQAVNLPFNSLPSSNIMTALKIQNYSGRGPHVYGTTMQKFPVTPGKTYQISLWAAAENLASHSGVLISVDAQWRIRPIRLSKGTYGWTEFKGQFTASDNFAYIRIIAEDRGTVYLTGIEITDLVF